MRTSTASGAVQGRSHRPGRASGCATRCANGASDTAGHRRQPTGHPRTQSDAAARRSNDLRPETGLRRRPWSTCTAAAPPLTLTRSRTTDGQHQPGAIARRVRYLPTEVPDWLTQRNHAPDRDTATVDGWHELQVANPTFLLERLGSECTDLQGLRELTVNGLDAIAAQGPNSSGRIVWDLDWQRFDASGGRVRKLSVTDTGTGMTPEQLRQYINQLASSGREQSAMRQLRRRREGRRRLPQPERARIPLLATRPGRAGVLQAPPRRPLGPRAPALAGRAQRLLASTRRAGQAMASARPGPRHPGRAARRARAPRHHPAPGQRQRRSPAMDHPLPQRPVPAPPRPGRGARPRAARPRPARTATAHPRRATPPPTTCRSRQAWWT